MLRSLRAVALVATAMTAPVTGQAWAQAADAAGARAAVQRFYAAFNSHGWNRANEFTTDDWVHINPGGGVTRGRATVLAELREVHGSFLKGVTDTPDSIAVRLATPDVAVATVPSRLTEFTTPDGVRHVNERQVRTFVVVRRAGAWRIMQDQNTVQAR